jgi:hypothetical protein
MIHTSTRAYHNGVLELRSDHRGAALITGHHDEKVPYAGSGQMSGVVWCRLLITGVFTALYLVFRRNVWL